MKKILQLIGLITLVAFSSCWLKPIDYHDKKLAPYLKAISKVQHLRDSLGFSTISEKAKISLEGKSNTYDAMVHIYQSISSWTIAFKKNNNEYVWIGEPEIFNGPKQFETTDGTTNETITLNYDAEPISGFPLDTLSVIYYGPDSSHASQKSISLSEARRLIKKWEFADIHK